MIGAPRAEFTRQNGESVTGLRRLARHLRAVRRRLQTVKSALRHRFVTAGVALAVGLAGTGVYLNVLDQVYPIDTWLFWSMAALWGWLFTFSLACVCMGQLILERMLRLALNPLESALQSMSVGVVAFVMCMYLGGALGLYGPVFAVLLPLAFTAAGARSGLRLIERFRVERSLAKPMRPFAALVSAAGVGCAALVYLQAMTPDSLNYDSTWTHLVIAQDYARNGRIVPLPGNYNMCVPHLASIIHTWGWTVPGLGRPALRWMMALHNEFGLFVWTLVGVSAGVRRLTGEPGLRAAWVGFFLFPIIFVYDNNLGGAADHIAAFFAVPMLLAALALWETFTPNRAALLAITAAGGLLTKYQMAYLFVPIALLLTARWALLAFRLRRGRPLSGDASVGWRELGRTPLVLCGVGALLVAPHFLKNLIFYNNPVYPLATELFTGSWPTVPGGADLIRYVFTDDKWRPKGSALEKLWHAAKLFFTFSFYPHYSFTRSVPAMGSLFTLLLPLLVVLPRVGRIWFGAVMASGAILIWAYTYNVDRNLQIFMPLMACVAVAVLVRAWRLGWLARAGLAPLVLLQVVWGSDALFYSGYGRLESSVNLIRTGFEGNAHGRLEGYRRTFLSLEAAIPEQARVLLHTSHVSLGIDREVIQDWAGFQGLISYDGLRSVRELYDYFSAHGITHILFEPGARGAPSKQEEILFHGLVTGYAEPMGTFGHFRLLRMPEIPPPDEAPYRVAMLGMAPYEDGLYPVEALSTKEGLPGSLQHYAAPSEPMPAGPDVWTQLLSQADAAIVNANAHPDAASKRLLNRRFKVGERYHGYFTVYVPGGKRSE